MCGIGVHLALAWPYYLGLAAAAALIMQQYREIKDRDRAKCFKAFLDNNRVGAAVFAGVLLSYWLS